MRTFRTATLLALVAVLGTSPAMADLPSIRLDRIQPLGAAAGTTVELQIQGRDLVGVTGLWFDRPGFTAEPLEGNKFRVTIPADVPEGTWDVRVVGRYGISNPRAFAVNHGLSDVTEQEPNNQEAEAQAIALNTAVNGVSDGNNQDVFRFPVTAGARVVVWCLAQSLESELDATLQVTDAAGRIVASNGDYFGRDPLAEFVAAADGEYRVTLHDLSYRGGLPYRLLVTTRPLIENVFPNAVQLGTTAELTAWGRNLGPQGVRGSWQLGDLLAEEFRFSWQPPNDAGTFRFLWAPNDHSVLPTAATASVVGSQVVVPLSGSALRAPVVLHTADPVVIESEPNDRRENAQAITLPATVCGRFGQGRDGDWFMFETVADGQYAFEVYSERIAGRADPVLVLFDEQGNRINEFDDFGPRVNAFDGHLRDPSTVLGLQKNKKYYALVKDRYARGGARYQYVMTARPAAPDFQVLAIHNENPGPDGVTVWAGGSTHLDLIVIRQEGFNQPITIEAVDLPPGLHAAPTTIDADSRGTFVLWSDPGMGEWTGKIRLVAKGQQGEQTLVREVRPYTRIWAVANVSSSRPMRELTVAVRQTAPYAVRIEPENIAVEAGQSVRLKLVVDRLWPEFKEKVRGVPLAFPGNFQMPEIEIAAGQTEVVFEVKVQPNTRPGRQTLSVQGQAPAPYTKDPMAPPRGNPLVSQASRPVTLTVTAPPTK